MNLEYSVFCSRQHYFDEIGTSWSDLKMGSLDSELEMFSLKEKWNSLWIFILKTVLEWAW